MRRLLAQKLIQEGSHCIQIRKNKLEISKSAIDRSTDPRANRKAIKALSLAAGFAALLFASSSIASTNPVIFHLRPKILCELARKGC